MIVYHYNLIALVRKWLLKNHSSRTYLHFYGFCMLQKTNRKAALCIVNKLGQEHLITTA